MSTKSRGIRSVRWWTSPSCARFLEHLECRGDASPDQLAEACHNGHKYAVNLTLKLKAAGIIHVRAWRHNKNGSPSPIYRLGPGKNRPPPKPETTAQRCRRRRASLISIWGRKAAEAVLEGKGRRIVIEGHTVRPGDHDSHLAGKVTG